MSEGGGGGGGCEPSRRVTLGKGKGKRGGEEFDLAFC